MKKSRQFWHRATSILGARGLLFLLISEVCKRPVITRPTFALRLRARPMKALRAAEGLRRPG